MSLVEPGGRGVRAALADLIASSRWQDDEDANRIDQVRVELVGYLGLINAAFEFVVAFFRPSVAMMVLTLIGIAVLVGFIVAARSARTRPVDHPWARNLPVAFMAIGLLLSVIAGYLIGRIAPMPYGYSVVTLAFAAIFMTPPRQFAAIVGGTYLVYALLAIVSVDHSMLERVIAMFNTGLACLTATIIRLALYRLRLRDRSQREIIADQNTALEAANTDLAIHIDELNELMAVAAHDLRSPLFGLRNLLELAGDRPAADPDFYRRVLEQGSGSVTAMLELIARILEAHELEAMAELDLRVGDIRTVAIAARKRNASLATAASVSIAIDQPPGPLAAAFEPHAMERAIDNLVSNAIRFSPPGGTVTLRCLRASGRAQLAVTDQGVGIPTDEQDLLFGKFQRGSIQPVHGERGSGLGLYIAYTLMAAMGGDIRYESGAGGGSTFVLRLPLPRAGQAA